MSKRDGRSLDHQALEDLRIQAVQRVEAGESPEDVVRVLGFSRTVIYDWLAKYREGGLDALRARAIPGRPPRLTGKQIEKLYKAITTKSPMQYRFEFALWTRAMVRDLIRDRFGVRLSDVSVGRLLKKMGLTPQKPLRRAYEQDPELVQTWLAEDYPEIKALAKREGATIWFADEAGIRSDFHAGTTWAPKGQTPVVEATGQRFGMNLVSAVSPRGDMRFMAIEGRMNAGKFIDFLKRLIHDAERPAFVIVDGHPSHRARKVREFVRASDGKVRLFFLPPYSPELNPDELVWNHLKTHGIGKKVLLSRDELVEAVYRGMRSLQKTPALIKRFFHERHVCYASE
ncbi:MAG: IS630 family transposase [Halofilum sp. (in: g-proteobacteria)]|nr:IS630 family transposase [Halofilum sp. (in: g-proteobacteria)]